MQFTLTVVESGVLKIITGVVLSILNVILSNNNHNNLIMDLNKTVDLNRMVDLNKLVVVVVSVAKLLQVGLQVMIKFYQVTFLLRVTILLIQRVVRFNYLVYHGSVVKLLTFPHTVYGPIL